MTHSLHNAAPREALTDTIMAAKIRHNLTFDALAEGTGLSPRSSPPRCWGSMRCRNRRRAR